jgi:hypothetical protein
MPEDSFYKYVPHHQQKLWEELGWTFHCDLGPPHAAYSSLYIWTGNGDPVVPNVEVKISKSIDMEKENGTGGDICNSGEEV